MHKQITVQQLAEETKIETEFLLRKIKQAGLSQQHPQDSISQQDRQKIKDILTRRKKTLSRRRNRDGGSSQTRPASSPAAAHSSHSSSRQTHKRRDIKAATGRATRSPTRAAKEKQPRRQKPTPANKAAQSRAAATKPRPTRPASATNLRTTAPKYKQETKLKDKKAKPKVRSTKTLVDKEEKTRQRFGVVISQEDALEMEEIKRKQQAQNAYKTPQSRAIPRGRVKVKNEHQFIRPTGQLVKEISVTDNLSISHLAHQLGLKNHKLLHKIRQLGFQLTEADPLDQETALLVIEELGHKAVVVGTTKSQLDQQLPAEATYQPRPPTITVMGHVDHGKTTLLDFIRSTKQVEKEAGQITQHLGAYKVAVKNRSLTFLDTPGHAAFVEMRLRGAKLTDIVILVVAADDGVMPQTREAIGHINATRTAAVVAINKIDKPEVDVEKIRKEVAALGLAPEEWGGNVPYVEISAINGKGIDTLLETLLVVADVLELKAATNIPARGYILESRLDKNMGPIATMLVRHGTLHKGDIVYTGNFFGRIKMLFDDTGKMVKQAVPSDPVEVLGLNGVPQAGDSFIVVPSEKEAKQSMELHKTADQQEVKKEKLDIAALMAASQQQKVIINLIIKADVQGSLAAISQLIADMEAEDTEIKMVSQGVGAINLGDIQLAQAVDAIIIGFNVRPDSAAKKQLKQNPTVAVQYFSIIYELADELQRVVKEKTELHGTEKIIGIAQVKEVFSARTYGQIAGCEVTEGIVHKDKPIRVLRDNTVIYEGTLESLRRFKDDVQEVQQGVECGIGVKGYKNVKVGDQIEVYDKRV